MRISDWSSDVCSSDLHRDRHWREGLALDSLEGEQRREHHEDDRLPEQRRADHLLDRTRHLLESLAHLEYSPLMRSEEHTAELQALMRNPYAVFCLKKKITNDRAKIGRNELINPLTNTHHIRAHNTYK